MSFAYLASPYSHPEKEVRQERFRAACKAAAQLMEGGRGVFAPIPHSHPIEEFVNTNNHDFWMRQDYPLLIAANELVVLMLPGWEQSKGVAEEIRVFKLLGRPITYMEPV